MTEQSTVGDGLALMLAASVFVSAFLLFQIEPLISKFILPWFGGSPAVWTTCLLFFQVVLFCGYAYAHLSTRFFSPRVRVLVHCALLTLALVLLHVAPSEPRKLQGATDPTISILVLLCSSVGLPYFALSATGPLLQSWFADACPGRSPYRLYALSNVGSLLALLSYPFVFEPALDVLAQARLWSYVFAGFAFLCAACAIGCGPALLDQRLGRTAGRALRVEARGARAWLERVRWVGLPACASLALLATTNHVTSDVAVIPFLWVVPLSLYLLTFIIAFDQLRWYRRSLFAALAVGSCLLVACIDPLGEALEFLHYDFSFVDELILHFAALFCICMVCHGELVRSRPSPARLTEFYLSIAAGGALGGIFVTLLAPALFSTFFEWTISLLLSFALGGVVLFRARFGTTAGRAVRWFASGAAVLGVFAILYCQRDEDTPLAVLRNFYGVVSVYESDRADPSMHHFSLAHGIVVHGRQFAAADRKREPVAYYANDTGVGQALRYFQSRPDLRVGAVGLGVGTIAAYVGPGQTLRFYEINEQVWTLARRYFSYLQDSPAQTQIVLGDARLSLELEAPQNFHVLVLDAFSGDAVPAHLLTKEAFAIYLRHLQRSGVIAVNITNRHLDLAPVVTAAARAYGLETVRIFSQPDPQRLSYRADWLLLTKNADFLAHVAAAPPPNIRAAAPLLWTDHYSNLFRILQ